MSKGLRIDGPGWIRIGLLDVRGRRSLWMRELTEGQIELCAGEGGSAYVKISASEEGEWFRVLHTVLRQAKVAAGEGEWFGVLRTVLRQAKVAVREGPRAEVTGKTRRERAMRWARSRWNALVGTGPVERPNEQEIVTLVADAWWEGHAAGVAERAVADRAAAAAAAESPCCDPNADGP